MVCPSNSETRTLMRECQCAHEGVRPTKSEYQRRGFVSRHSQANIVAGMLESKQELLLESLMPSGGAVFSDGMEADFPQFNSGAIATVRAADQRVHLVVS